MKLYEQVDGASETTYVPVYDDGVTEMSESSLEIIHSFLTSVHGQIRLETMSPKRIFNGLGVIAIHAIDLKNDWSAPEST